MAPVTLDDDALDRVAERGRLDLGAALASLPFDQREAVLLRAVGWCTVTRFTARGRTTGAGAYHNARFRELGAELGLRIERHPTIGWSLTIVPEATAAAYAAEFERLRTAVVHVRESEHRRRPGTAGGAAARGAEPATRASSPAKLGPARARAQRRPTSARASPRGGCGWRGPSTGRRGPLRRLRRALHSRRT